MDPTKHNTEIRTNKHLLLKKTVSTFCWKNNCLALKEGALSPKNHAPLYCYEYQV